MAGYHGYSMSNNAIAAYWSGEKPISKWTKKEIIDALAEAVSNGEIELKADIIKIEKMPVKTLKEACLYRSSWHHTSSRYNRTDFYSLDVEKIEELTNAKIDEIIADQNKEKKEEPKEETWKCSFLEWSGTRKHPKATRIEEIGTIRGNWFFRQDGSKKSTHANGFQFIEKIK